SFLENHDMASIPWTELEVNEPTYFFTKKDFQGGNEYETGFKLNELFITNANGIKTQNDKASIAFSEFEGKQLYFDFLNLSHDEIRRGGPSAFPLYLYPEAKAQQTITQ